MRFTPLKAALLGALLTAAPVLAQTQDCSADPTAAACKLQHTLHLLYWVAGVLGVLLAIVVGLAVAIYRRNRTAELTRR